MCKSQTSTVSLWQLCSSPDIAVQSQIKVSKKTLTARSTQRSGIDAVGNGRRRFQVYNGILSNRSTNSVYHTRLFEAFKDPTTLA